MRIKLPQAFEPLLRASSHMALAVKAIKKLKATLRFLILFGAFALVSPAWSQEEEAEDDPTKITFEGLVFPCKECIKLPDDSCEISIRKERLVVPCDKLIDFLVPVILEDESYDGEHPDPNEIRRYILSRDVSERSATLLIQLLAQSEVGRRVLSAEASQFFVKYSKAIKELIVDGKGDREMWHAYWRLPASDGIAIDEELRAAIVLSHPRLSLNDLFAELTVVDLEADLADLAIYREVFAKAESGWVEELDTTIEVAQICSKIVEAKEIPEKCSREELEDLPKAASQYLQRLQLHYVMQQIGQLKLKPVEVIDQFRQLNYRQYRTPETHRLMLAAIRSAGEAHFASERVEFLDEENFDVLEVFSRNDRAIANELAYLLSRTAEEAWQRGELDHAMGYLERSFRISPKPFLEREQIFDKMIDDPEVQKVERIYERLREMRYDKVIREVTVGDPTKRLLLLSWLAFFIVVAIGISVWRRKVREEIEQEILETEEREELRELLEFFELDKSATEDDLTKVYRRKAKETHPDTGEGSSEEFSLISSNYQRAKALLWKYNLAEDEFSP